MAVVTRPPALDKSINTTEQTPRNIADVLAEELARIAENILPPNAEDIAYDNTASGLTATNVQDAIDEVISSQADVIADTMADLTENKTATVTDGVADFETIDGSLVKSLVVEIEPSQSGSGTPSPSNIRPITGWTQEDVTVVGKNKLPLVLADIKSANTDGTWTGNDYTISGVTFTVLVDSDDNVIGIKTNRTANAQIIFYLGNTPNSGDYILNGCPAGGSHVDGYSIYITGVYVYDIGSGTNVSLSGTSYPVAILIRNGTDVSNKTFLPMLRLSTVTDSTFEPYHGKTYTTPFNQTVYGGTLDVLTGELTITHGYVDLGSLTWARSSTRDSSKYRFNASHTPLPKPTATNADIPNLYSSNYTAISPSDTYQNVTGATIAANGSIYMYDEALATSTGAEFKTAMNGVQLVYELETPTTISLTPQTVKALVGENHIMASTGDVLECKYSELINGDDIELSEKSSIYSNAGSHNAIYRGKYLGTAVTAEQYSAINDGTFKDLFIGDFWTINGVNWRIAHFDYWLNTGDTNCTTHHVVIVPDSNLYTAQMNDTNTTEGGYYNSAMRGGANYPTGGNLANAKTAIDNAFGSSHILSHRELLTNATSNGNASGWAWYDSTVDLMSEIMVYGTLAWSVGGKGYEVGIDKEQLALFRLDHSRICNRATWWLRSVYSATPFAAVRYDGSANSSNASSSVGVCPCFAIRG